MAGSNKLGRGIKTYLVCNVQLFPQGEDKITVPSQPELDILEGYPETWFRLIERSWYDGFDRYEAYHEVLVKTPGKVFGQRFHHYLAPHEFFMYHNPTKRLLLINAKTQVAKDFIKATRLLPDT